MKSLVVALTCFLILFWSSEPDKTAARAAGFQNISGPELAEASRLGAQVVELYRQREYKDALPLAKRCLQIREKLLEAGDERLRTALNNLALVYMALQKYDEAGPFFERLIKSYDQYAPKDSRLANALQGMALVEFTKGNSSKTEDLYKRAVQLTEGNLGEEHPSVENAVFLLAEFYQFIGDYRKAEPLYKRLITIREKQSRAEASEELKELLDRYSCLLHKTKRENEAHELESRVYGSGGLPSDVAVVDDVINGRAIKLPKPPYPDEARSARASGTVIVRVAIDETGKVIRACAIAGPPLLTRVSELAARHALFTPAKLKGQPVKVTGVITYNFVHQ